MSKTTFLSALLAASAFVSSAFGQINLSYLNSQSVRNWNWTGTRIDSVTIETKVGNGLANTKLTFSVEPQGWYNCRSEYQTMPDTVWYTYYQYNAEKVTSDSTGRTYYLNWYKTVCDDKPTALDSLQISSWFNLPTDFVAKNMWLWINGQPVTAYIQDKMLAQTQYNQIVGRRRDPALLTYNGNGSYQFLMYPLSSFQARKVAIEFQHTFTDDTLNLISACIPVTFDTANAYWYWWDGKGREKHGVGHVRATLTATDNKTYSFGMQGLGAGIFSKNSNLTLDADNVVKLGVGDINTTDPSGSKTYAWTGANAKTSAPEAGFSTMIAESTVTLEPEPATRIIVLDIHQAMWDWKSYYKVLYETQGSTWNESYFSGDYYMQFNMWQRAQKFAVVALKNYVTGSRKFNLIINGNAVFSTPVAGTPDNMLAAYSAIMAASPVFNASTVDALKRAVGQAGKDIVIFISDLMSPPNGWGPYHSDPKTGSSVQDTLVSGKLYLARLDSLRKIMDAYKGTLFTICDDYYYYGNSLSGLAYASGGFQLASLRERYYYPLFLSNDNNGAPSNASTNKTPMLPRLYLDRGGITDVKVTFADGTSDGLIYNLDGYSYWWYGWANTRALAVNAAIDKTALAKKSGLAKMALPYYYGNMNSQMLRVAFPVNGSSLERQIMITGKMGGLHFSRLLNVAGDAVYGDPATSVEWGFRKAEYLAHTQWNNNWTWDNWNILQDSIKAVGYAYHIITTNTAFLALEPGMQLFIDSSMAQAQASANDASKSFSVTAGNSIAAQDTSSSQTGQNLDDVSLEDLIAGTIPVINEKTMSKKVTEFKIAAAKRRIAISIPDIAAGKDISLSIYDLQGRLVMSRNVSSKESLSGRFFWDLASQREGISSGFYALRIATGATTALFKLPALR